MGLFKKKKKILDLTEQFKKQQEVEAESAQASEADINFLGGLAGAGSSQETSSRGYIDVSSGLGDKKRKLAKRLTDMTGKMEDISNQIYHLQQRIELIERKLKVGF